MPDPADRYAETERLATETTALIRKRTKMAQITEKTVIAIPAIALAGALASAFYYLDSEIKTATAASTAEIQALRVLNDKLEMRVLRTEIDGQHTSEVLIDIKQGIREMNAKLDNLRGSRP